jgi:hypothetical protein
MSTEDTPRGEASSTSQRQRLRRTCRLRLPAELTDLFRSPATARRECRRQLVAHYLREGKTLAAIQDVLWRHDGVAVSARTVSNDVVAIKKQEEETHEQND